MDTAKINRIFVSLLLIAICYSCDNSKNELVPIESIFKILPDTGLTTTQFEFDASQTFIKSNEENPILIRYDWQNDGIWDQDYCTDLKITHRYLKPGMYKIKMEARTLEGIRDTSTSIILVKQGYSPPFPSLFITPDSANIYTRFFFDASNSYDDEDSSDLLTFRWDFDGDGIWDTEFSSSSIIHHQFTKDGKFNAQVEVKDPSMRSSIIRKPLTVNLLNDSIKPQFTADGGFSTVVDVFKFDASGSTVLGQVDKNLTYSWDILNDGLWEAVNLPIPSFTTLIKSEGLIKVKLRVTDERGLYMDKVQTVEVFPENSPPTVVLVLCNRIGNTQSKYFFNTNGTYDRETSILDLKYQWDLDGDGIWEPEYDNLREVDQNYDKVGKHLVRLKVTDSHNDSKIATDTVFVYSGEHETGYILDSRRYPRDYYSIVKIGDIWWMQENLRIEIEPGPGGKPPGILRACYGGSSTLCDRFGGLYQYYTGKSSCPDGWRLPTKVEFQEMVKSEAPNSLAQLLLGGSSELHFLMSGYLDIERHSIGYGNATNFWLEDRSISGSPIVWYIDTKVGENRSVISSTSYYYSVRCVKND